MAQKEVYWLCKCMLQIEGDVTDHVKYICTYILNQDHEPSRFTILNQVIKVEN